MTTPEPRLPGISVREAAIRLGVSESDVRRRIQRGELRAEKLPRPGGTLLRVLLDAPADTPTPPQPAPEARQDAPEAYQAMAGAVTALSDMTQRQGRQIDAQAETIADLRERIGRSDAARAAWQARARAAEARAAELAAEVERLRGLAAEKARRWWKWW